MIVVDIDRSMIESSLPPTQFPKHEVRKLIDELNKVLRPQLSTCDYVDSISLSRTTATQQVRYVFLFLLLFYSFNF